jgi:RNA polymerase-binding transcription factor DksA
MTQAELENYRERLIALGKRINHDVDQLEGEALNGVGGEPSGNLSNAPLHLADLGTHQYEEALALTLVENEQLILDEIRAALERIHQRNYGVCEDCRRPIAKERLEAVPYTRYCVDCAAEHERSAE